ncbi:flagellar basal body-associated protein FliL [Egicoccus sp. AB-alg6-2]|uniref:flagellar basal body-associated FliL family protein n=1 Tax=Egicoccus sp. AB-alg6-2 TaxID=3242692 RepID=UPI00359EECFC
MSEAVVVEVEEETSSKKKLLLIGAVVVVLVAGVAAWWLFLKPAGEEVAVEPADGAIVSFEPLTTTLGVSAPSHARVTLAVVLTEDADPTVLDARKALLQDALLQEIATMGADQLRSAEGSAQLRAALTEDAKTIWGEDVVRRVVLTELLVQ